MKLFFSDEEKKHNCYPIEISMWDKWLPWKGPNAVVWTSEAIITLFCSCQLVICQSSRYRVAYFVDGLIFLSWQVIAKARVPIVKFLERNSGIAFDIRLNFLVI